MQKILIAFLVITATSALLLAILILPPVHECLSWRVANLRAEIFYFFNPPDDVVFSLGQQAEMTLIISQTLIATVIPPTATVDPSPTPTDYDIPTPTLTLTPTPTPTPIPEARRLEGVQHEYQAFNYCGPANVSMALSYWGWEGDQHVTAARLKPNPKDRDVMPYEMVDYVRTQTHLNAVLRWGGDLEMIKNFIAAGFPVLIERGFEEEVPQKTWMGHYNVLTAYDETKETFLVQDSFVGSNYTNSYERIQCHWRAFNCVYIIIYPPYQEAKVFEILGPHADEIDNLQHAAHKASEEISVLSGRELFFAWYNYRTSLVNLGDYYDAAQAYDQAYEVYAALGSKPWRITWYNTGPYFAYYYTGRYQDVIDLADMTLSFSFEPAIEVGVVVPGWL